MLDENSNSTKHRILKSAEKLFYELGYKNTSYSAIADESGTSQGAIYYLFNSKINIASEIYSKFLRNVKQISAEKLYQENREFDSMLSSVLEFSLHLCAYNLDPKIRVFVSEYTSQISFTDKNYLSFKGDVFYLINRQYKLGFLKGELDFFRLYYRIGYFATVTAFYEGFIDLPYEEFMQEIVCMPLKLLKIPEEQIEEKYREAKEILNSLELAVSPYFQFSAKF